MLLNDYTDYFPFMVYRTDLLVEPDVLTDGRPSADVSELFPVPLDVDLLSDVTISRELPGETTVLVSTPSEYELAVSASGVYAADGYMYYVLLLSGEDGRQFDASLLPGGGWGVWRFDCESEGEGASERWCVDDQAKISVSMDSAENVLPLAGNASAAKLFLSYDGEAVLLFTAESGELWLTTYNVSSGEARRERLIDAGEAAALGASLSLSGMRGIVEQEHSLFICGGAGIYFADGEHVMNLALTDRRPEQLAGEDYAFLTCEYAFACDGGRLAVLTSGQVCRWTPQEGGGRSAMPLYTAQRLDVFGHGGALLCSLWLENDLDYMLEQEGYETFRDAEGAIFSRQAAALRTLTELYFN